ncbi:helix-turn-helix domain-containing protein [Rhizobium calliandrae]|uniref:Helix-turn-helix domain-containing protein n=1 Tax=Rhizobium calliandrae TaxID=1312182 RepID=A0ABT7KNY5_9HYPH|nr:helix-turn-helix domain-containing protein [Rhizobium calliandrae]MDL2410350.1 helix-turn-helix domain-containing protein [Rhizobium calliandrae]
MRSGIPLRNDFDGFALRALAKGTKDAAQARRLLALAEIYDGHSRSDAARIGGVTLQIVRDWVIRFNARGPSGLINGKAPGNQGKLSDVHRQALAKIVESGPIPAVHGVVRWRRKDLVQWLFQEYRISVDEVDNFVLALGIGSLRLSLSSERFPKCQAHNDEFDGTQGAGTQYIAK